MKNRKSTNFLSSLFLACLAFFAWAETSVFSGDFYWSGTGDWEDGTNLNGKWSTTSGSGYGTATWSNGNNNAYFEGTPGTVSVVDPITLDNLYFTSANSNYLIDGGTLTFNSGGTIDMTVKNQKHTITSAISGSPDVRVINGTGYEGLTFAPTSGTVTLGSATVPYDDPVGGDKAGLHLGGTTLTNSIASVGYGGGDQYGTLYKEDSGTWAVGNVKIGAVKISGGNFVANGEIDTDYQGLQLSGGTLHYNNAGAVKDGAFRMLGGDLDNTSGGAITNSTYNPAMSWEADFSFLGTNDLKLGTGAVTLTGGDRQVTVNAGNLTIGGGVTDSANTYGLTKAGSGTLTLNGTNDYNGPTTITGGILSLNQASLYTGALLDIQAGQLDLSFGGTNDVLLLKLGGVTAAVGTWGATGSGATNIDDTYFSGTGIINNTGGFAPAGTYYWDGPNAGGTGNAASDGGSGTWDTTTTDNWDRGYVAKETWTDDTGSKAIFAAGAGTVTLGTDVTVGEMVIETSDGYQIGSNTEDSTMHFGGATNKITVDSVTATIKAGITGSPDIYTPGGFREKLYLDPYSQNMTIGEIHIGEGSSSNPEIYLRGSAGTDNSVALIQKEHSWAFVTKDTASTWRVGNVNARELTITAGTFVANGTIDIDNNRVLLNGGEFHYNNAAAIVTGDVLRIAGGNLDNTSGSAIIATTNHAMAWNADFTFIGSNDLDVGTGAVTMNGNRRVTVTAGTLTVGGDISESGGSWSLTKDGPGTLKLTGAGNYTGGTFVDAGTLVWGSTTSVGAMEVATGSALAPGGSIGTLALDSLIWNSDNATAGMLFELGTGEADLLSISGSFTKGTGADFIFDFTGGNLMETYTVATFANSPGFVVDDFLATGAKGIFTLNTDSLQFQIIPEPSTAILAGLGLAGVCFGRRRNK